MKKFLPLILLAALVGCTSMQGTSLPSLPTTTTHAVATAAKAPDSKKVRHYTSAPTIYVADATDNKVETWTETGSVWSDTGPDQTFDTAPTSVDVDQTTGRVAVALNADNAVNVYTVSGSSWTLYNSISGIQSPFAVRYLGPNLFVSAYYGINGKNWTGIGQFGPNGTLSSVSDCIGHNTPACVLDGAIGAVTGPGGSNCGSGGLGGGNCPTWVFYAEADMITGGYQQVVECPVYSGAKGFACTPFIQPIQAGGDYGIGGTLGGGGTSGNYGAIAFGTDLKDYLNDVGGRIGTYCCDLTTLNGGNGTITQIGDIPESSDTTFLAPVNTSSECKVYGLSATTGSVYTGFPFSAGSITCNDAAGTGF